MKQANANVRVSGNGIVPEKKVLFKFTNVYMN